MQCNFNAILRNFHLHLLRERKNKKILLHLALEIFREINSHCEVYEIFVSLAQCDKNENLLTLFWQKFRESNIFTKEITK